MKFEISEKLETSKDKNEVYDKLKKQFSKVARVSKYKDNKLFVKMINATFGSINRSDKTNIKLHKKDYGYLAVAEVKYRPSVAFWFILVLLIFTYVLWLLPIGFYLYQKKLVKEEIRNVLNNIKNDLAENNYKGQISNRNMEYKTNDNETTENKLNYLDELEKLSNLKEKGVITEEEFRREKDKVLNNSN